MRFRFVPNLKIIDLGWPWTTLNSQYALWCRQGACFGAHCTNLNAYMQRQKCRPMTSWKYEVHADIPGGFSWRGPQMRVGCRRRQFLTIWVATSSKTSEIIKASDYIWRYASATPYRPVIEFSGYFMLKSVFGRHFLAQSVWLSKIIAWKVTNIDQATSGTNVGQWLLSGNINYF